MIAVFEKVMGELYSSQIWLSLISLVENNRRFKKLNVFKNSQTDDF